MKKSSYEAEILVNGRPVREYSHTDGNIYIEGRKGSQFTIRVRNNSSEEILAVPTVDGLSVINGKRGNYDSGGYVLRPFSHVDIPGWRLNNDEVAKFIFAEFDESYAAQMDQPDNVGVIGIAIFRKKRPMFDYTTLHSFGPMRGGGGPMTKGGSPYTYGGGFRSASKGIGTGFGERTEHRVQTVDFERATTAPHMIFAFHYDNREGLIERGVNLKPVLKVANPFPGETGCTPPKGWNG